MTLDELNYKYLDWMYDLVCDDRYTRDLGYRKLFAYLYDTEFTYTIPMDGNRWEDGVNLRYRFGREQGYDDRMISAYLDTVPCSVLEMMIALALRCEEHIMDNPDVGNRVGQWFWQMIVNLGLGRMTDKNFDPDYTQDHLDHFLMRKYSRNGAGGLFVIHDKSRDMRTADIWYQMCWYLREVIDGEA